MRILLMLAASAVALSACGQKTDTAASGAAAPSGGGGARNQVWAAGSSTVFPFATRVAETVSKTTGGAAAKVESLAPAAA